MKKLLLKIARWLAKLAGEPLIPVSSVPADVLRAAKIAVTTADEAWDGQSGEFKRHQVYAALIKKFPATPKRVLSRAIEEALD